MGEGMAWNPTPQVAAARDYGKRFGRQQVIILALDRKEGTYEVVTYGETMALCAGAKRLGDVAALAAMRAMWEDDFET